MCPPLGNAGDCATQDTCSYRDYEAEQRVKRGAHADEDLLEVARAAAAQGAISILLHFDALAREAGIEVSV